MTTTICETRWDWNSDGTITLHFHNNLTDVHAERTYRNRAAAKGAETKFHNRVERIYNEQRVREILERWKND